MVCDSEGYEENDLEEAWDLLNSRIYNDPDLGSNREKNADNPLTRLGYYLEFDMYPPPEVLLAINKIFQDYLSKKGNIDLEEAFFGKPIKSLGNYSARMAKHEGARFLDILLQINDIDAREGRNSLSQYEIAQQYLGINSEEDPESLLRKLRRHRRKCNERI